MPKPPDGTGRRRCGDCTACCTVMGVVDLPGGKKMPGVRCPELSSRGCRVYADRPQTCREFACVWLQGGVPKPLRPDRIGVVFTTDPTGKILVGHADPARPNHWRGNRDVMAWLGRCGRAGAEVWMGVSGSGRVDVKFTADGMIERPPEEEIDPTALLG